MFPQASIGIRVHIRACKWTLPAVIFICSLAALTAASQQAPPAPAGPAARFVVVLDAAHGGDDTGAQLANGKQEKALTLALSVRLRSLLAARGIPVVTTRESDASIDSNRRAELANHANAQACLSIHASESGGGIHIFISSLAPTQPGRWAAWKTSQSAWVTRSSALAGEANSALLHAGFTVTLGRTTLPAIDSMSCPAIAIEISPERDTNHAITAELDDADYQARIATALAAALVSWRSEAHQ
jgi:N-acetylmuramoyl-L-alanine amidase